MRTCEVDRCNAKHFALGYCERHYYQFKKNGEITKRTMYDTNEIIIEDGICRIFLYNKKGDKIAEAVIDEDDYEIVKDYKWGLKGEYVYNAKYKICIHNAIMPVMEGCVDHINGNPLDNKKTNLRKCTLRQNSLNRKLNRGKINSKYKGVTFYPYNGKMKWQGRIRVNGNVISLGYFRDQKKAAKAYNEAAVKHFKEFARLNHI